MYKTELALLRNIKVGFKECLVLNILQNYEIIIALKFNECENEIVS